VLAVICGSLAALLAAHIVGTGNRPVAAVLTRTAGPAPLRVLFIGNSYTAVNDLPGMFSLLAAAGGHPVQAAALDEGGWTLAQHAAAAETVDALQPHRWDFVVLQEQSEIPASAWSRSRSMYPAAQDLVGKIRAAGADPLLYLTWAHRDGWPENGLKTYAAMQDQLTAGYMQLALKLHAPVAPVGEAWRQAIDAAPSSSLWQADGSHPTTTGTYLAACVFYASLFRKSPVGIPYTADLADGTAQAMQALTDHLVLTDPWRWDLQ
jgi:hypothetical protein